MVIEKEEEISFINGELVVLVEDECDDVRRSGIVIFVREVFEKIFFEILDNFFDD